MMNVNITIGEFVEILNKELESIKGKSVKSVGIAFLIKEALQENILPHLSCFCLDYDPCQIVTSANGLEFVRFIPNYKPDRRSHTGKGDYVESISISVNELVSPNDKLINVKKILEYSWQKNGYKRNMNEYKKKLIELAHLRENAWDTLFNMHCESYDDKTSREVDELSEEFYKTLGYYSPKVITERATLSYVKSWMNKWKVDCGEEKQEGDVNVVINNSQNVTLFEGHFLDVPDSLWERYVSDYFVDEMNKGDYVLTVREDGEMQEVFL